MVGWELQCSEDSNIKCMCVCYITFLSVYRRKKISVFCMKQTMAAYIQRAEINLTLNKSNNNKWHHFVLAYLVNEKHMEL